MTVDLTGGLDPAREFMFATQPSDPEMRESVNAWIWSDGGEFGLPRIGIEAVADQWDTHDIQVNIAFADGRVLSIFEPGAAHDPLGGDGLARVLGAGPLSFELIEPFVRWRIRLDGPASVTTIDDQMADPLSEDVGDETVEVHLDVDVSSAAPPWEAGTLLEEAGHILATQIEGDLMGGPRFEQLFRCSGSLQVGDEVHAVDGGGLRIRRTGVRRLAHFWGHCWQSAVFPSGRGFGCNSYPPRADGKDTFNEGYLFEGDGALVPARVVQAPWLRRIQPPGEDVSLVLETEAGTTRIEGESLLSTLKPLGPPGSPMGLTLQQAIARYSLDGESANGMLERSSPNDVVDM